MQKESNPSEVFWWNDL